MILSLTLFTLVNSFSQTTFVGYYVFGSGTPYALNVVKDTACSIYPPVTYLWSDLSYTITFDYPVDTIHLTSAEKILTIQSYFSNGITYTYPTGTLHSPVYNDSILTDNITSLTLERMMGIGIWDSSVVITGYKSTITSIESTETTSTVDVYPNPTTGLVNTTETFETLNVYDLNGELITTETNKNSVDLTNEPNGLYLFNISTKDGNVVKRVEKE